MISLALAEALVREKVREACYGGQTCAAEWCRLECRPR